MKHKQLLWLVAVLAVLLAIAFVTGVFDGDVSTVDVPEVTIPVDLVTAVEIRSPDFEVRLAKQGSLWVLVEPVSGRADSTTISELLEDVSTLKFASVVSRSAERYRQYGVDSAGTEVSLSWTGSERAFVIGRRGPDYASSYVRMEGDGRVFLTRKVVDVPRELELWRDKVILDLPVAEISGASVRGPDRNYLLSRAGEKWTIEGQPADSASVRRWLDRFAPFRADGFFNGGATASDSAYVVTFEGPEVRTLRFVPHEDDFAVEESGSGTAYRIRSVRIDQFVPEESFFDTR